MPTNTPLSGRTAVVTGASSGIGRAIARQLGGVGCHVFLAGRTAETMEDTVGQIRESGGKATAMSIDVRDPQRVRALVDAALQETERLDIMVNNAGLSWPGSIANGEVEHWREMLETNVLALLVGSREAIRAMRSCQAEGHVVNVSSIAGRGETSGVYGATKAAVNTICSTLRKELENDRIRVVNIMPGAVATNFARNFDPEFVQGLARAAGVEADFEPGQHMPQEAVDRLQKLARESLASADDVARAVLFAVTQPIELNVSELVVRPARQLQL